MINPGWQINAIFPGRFYEMYEIVNPEGRQVWCGTMEGLENVKRILVSDLHNENHAPDWMLGSLRQLRDRIIEKLVRLGSRAA